MDNTNNQYNEFAYYYDILMKDIDYDLWSDYIKRIIESCDVKYEDILEMACGTGNMSLKLAKSGYKVTAFDFSQDMLAVAADKALSSGLHIRFLKQDMRKININEEYGIVLCLCDSINYLTEVEDVKKLFAWVYGHLKDGGLFIFDINSSHKLKNIIGDNTFTYNEDDVAYIWDNYQTEDGCVEFYLTFFVKQDNLYRRFDEVHVEKIFEKEDIIKYLNASGFEEVRAYNAFTLMDANDKSERINFVARK